VSSIRSVNGVLHGQLIPSFMFVRFARTHSALRNSIVVAVLSTTTFGSANSGTSLPTGSSRSTKPCSTACMHAIPVTTFVQEKMGKIWSGSISNERRAMSNDPVRVRVPPARQSCAPTRAQHDQDPAPTVSGSMGSLVSTLLTPLLRRYSNLPSLLTTPTTVPGIPGVGYSSSSASSLALAVEESSTGMARDERGCRCVETETETGTEER
jgi:hypothetical protein